jgi:hypothetical protein
VGLVVLGPPTAGERLHDLEGEAAAPEGGAGRGGPARSAQINAQNPVAKLGCEPQRRRFVGRLETAADCDQFGREQANVGQPAPRPALGR